MNPWSSIFTIARGKTGYECCTIKATTAPQSRRGSDFLFLIQQISQAFDSGFLCKFCTPSRILLVTRSLHNTVSTTAPLLFHARTRSVQASARSGCPQYWGSPMLPCHSAFTVSYSFHPRVYAGFKLIADIHVD
jgi:hypothetical protein